MIQHCTKRAYTGGYPGTDYLTGGCRLATKAGHGYQSSSSFVWLMWLMWML